MGTFLFRDGEENSNKNVVMSLVIEAHLNIYFNNLTAKGTMNSKGFAKKLRFFFANPLHFLALFAVKLLSYAIRECNV